VTAPVFAVLGQRRPMQKVLAVSASIRAAAVAAAAVALALSSPPVAILYVLTLGEGVMSSAPNAIHDAMLPRVARRADELVSANALTSMLDLAGYVAGGAIAASLAFTLGTEACWWPSSRCSSPRRRRPQPCTWWTSLPCPPPAGRCSRACSGGARYLRRDGDARAVVATLALAAGISGLAVAMASDIAVVLLDMDAGGAPLLIALGGLGGLTGGLVMLRLIGSHPLAVLVAAGILITATAAFAILTASRVVAALAFLAFGAGTAAQAVGCRTLLHRVVAPRELGGAVGVNGLLSVASVGLGGVTASLLIVAVGLRPLLIGAGVAAIALALLVLRRLAASSVRQPLRPRARGARCRRGVRADVADGQDAAGDGLARHDVRAGEEIVREGDPADTMYVIEAGELGAYVDGRRVRTMAAGDHFGEVALLSGSTRTASVRAEDDAAIWSLSGGEFLAALRGNSEAHAIAAAVVDERRGRR
jgi:MFS family permease